MVRKRDGREVPFDQAKIADAIYRAARSVGGADRFLSEELASVVTMFIEKDWRDRVPSIEDVSDLIERVLVDTGHGQTAKAFILERDRRARIRDALRVRDDDAAPPSGAPTVDAPARATTTTWSKGKIVEALIIEADLPAGVAEEIAAEVERRVFASGLTRLSTSLIRALVDNELFERGCDRLIGRHSTIGVPRYDLDRLARSGVEGGRQPGCADAVDREVAAACWTQYSLTAVYPRDVADAHLTGRIHLSGLGSPTRYHALEIDADPAVLGTDVDSLRRLLCRVGELVDGRIRLRGVERILLAMVDEGMDPNVAALRLLSALGASAELPPRRPELELTWAIAATGGDECAAIFGAASSLRDAFGEVRPPRLLGDVAGVCDATRLDHLVLAEADPDRAAAFSSSPFAPGALSRYTPILLRVDVNVAQAAFRSARFDTSSVERQLEPLVAAATEACEARARYFESLPGAASPRERLTRLPESRGPMSVGGRFEIGLCGLDAACRVAFDQPPWREERARRFAEDLVDGFARLIAQQAKERRLPIAMGFTEDPTVRRRFGGIDFERFPRGREVHGVAHDGRAYLYASTVSYGDEEPDPAAAATLEARLRRNAAPSPIPIYHALLKDRARFLVAYAEQARRHVSECS